MFRSRSMTAAACALLLGGVFCATAVASSALIATHGLTVTPDSPKGTPANPVEIGNRNYSGLTQNYPDQELDSALTDSLAELAPDTFTDAHFGPPPEGGGAPTATWLYLTVPDIGGPETESLFTWQADLLAGAIADRIGGSAPLAGMTLSESSAAGQPVQLTGGALGAVVREQYFPLQDSSDAVITQHVQDVLTGYQLRPLEIEILRPLGAAVLIRAEAPTKEQLQGISTALLSDLGGTPAVLEGVYVELSLPSGEVVFVSGGSKRVGGGFVRFAPGYDELMGITHGSLPTK